MAVAWPARKALPKASASKQEPSQWLGTAVVFSRPS